MAGTAALQQHPKQSKQSKQAKSQSNRKAKGNDFFHKMLQLEKQVMAQRQQAASSVAVYTNQTSPTSPMNRNSPTSPTSPVAQSASNRTSAPPPVRQEQVAKQPKMSARVVTEEAKAPEPLRITTKNISQDSISSSSEICLSPAWSDHGQKERKEKRREIEKAERESKKKQEEENRKAPKRLNKKPPAAMDTQKMSADLRRPRRNSLMSLVPSRSSSREPSLERPREEKRLSGSSFTAFLHDRRSSSQQRPVIPAPDHDKSPQMAEAPQQFKPIVSSVAPKLPSFRWKKEPTTDGKAQSWGTHNVSDGELVAFPYGKEDPVIEKIGDGEADASPISHLTREPTIRHMIRSSTEPNLRPEAGNRQKKAESTQFAERLAGEKTLPSIPRVVVPTSRIAEQAPRPTPKPVSRKENDSNPQSPADRPKERQNSDEVAAELIAMLSDKQKPYQHVQTQMPKPYTNIPRDGSSYVHKQRMYEQQRSIAGFEEQQALQMFNEQAALADMQQENKDSQTAKNDKGTSREASPSSAKRNRSSSRGAKGANRSTSPSGRSSSQQPKPSALSPLKQVSTAPEDVSDDEREKKLKSAKEEILQKMQSAQLGKSDRILGFRRKNKDTPTSIQLPENKLKPTSAKAAPITDGSHDAGTPLKQSRRDRMSAHIPFKHKRDSSNGVVHNTARHSADQVGKVSEAKKFYENANTQQSTDSKVPASPQHPAKHSAADSKSSSESGESWHSTQESRKRSASAAAVSRSKPFSKPSMDSSVLAASYTEIIKTPSSEEDSLSDKSPTSSSHSHQRPESVQEEQERPKSPHELIVKTTTSEGHVRKTSITQSRSIPNLQSYSPQPPAASATRDGNGNVHPNLDFLPQLKHQSLNKSPRRSTQTSAENSPTRDKIGFTPAVGMPDTSYKSPLAPSASASGAPDLSLLPRSPFRTLRGASRSATSIVPTAQGAKTATEGGEKPAGSLGPMEAKPIAKLFVICCKCRFWHDLPSKLYEAMALPKELRKGNADAASATVGGVGKGVKKAEEGQKDAKGRVETAVKCPWCEHAMGTWCCQGWTTVVYLHERHH